MDYMHVRMTVYSITILMCVHFPVAFDAVVNGGWGTWDNAQYLCGKEVKNSVIGIVGMGRIGFATAQRLKAFKPSRILYSGNSPKEYAKEIDAEYVTFDDLLKESDFVIICLSVNPGNVGLFNAEAFKKMKKSAIFINTSRGVVVNQDDLYKALTLGQIYAAGLDVTTPEPLPRDNPLLTLPNVIITPHIGTATERARGAMAELTAKNILAGIKGDPLPSPVHM
ncbi:hypothetical protein CHS0354_030527 [Potamilus streckersoni]|uniref:Glyoxylate reductase/hydroxypyruvate reductase n=1 Tax=Potamilus streckersoni TaxID=2493646 RepID=A0AAE0VHU2_9BIVA|nr:hypothetical protein CHS0354_030527 [Potamilus streckersoni]